MIEEKLLRMTQQQRDEVEAFIDFIITRDSHAVQPDISDRDTGFIEIQERPEPAIQTEGTTSIFGRDISEARDPGNDLLPDYPEYGEMVNTHHTEGETPRQGPVPRRRPLPRNTDRDPGRLLDWVD